MEDFDSIFDPVDSDVELANAGAILEKIASENGIDLNSLSEESIAELLGDLMPQNATTQTKEAQMPQNATAQITHTDVALELSKIASANSIDLTTIPREEYEAAYNDLAEKMASDPAAYQAKLAEEEKLSEAYTQGVRMADGFLDRLKQAEMEEEEKKEKKEERKEEKEKEAAGSYSRGYTPETGQAIKNMAKGLVDKVRGTAAEKGKALSGAVKDHVAKNKDKYTHGAAAAGGAAVGGAAAALSRKKEASLEDLANDLAVQLVAEAGFSPETGEKVAADADTSSLAVLALAFDQIKKAGYLG